MTTATAAPPILPTFERSSTAINLGAKPSTAKKATVNIAFATIDELVAGRAREAGDENVIAYPTEGMRFRDYTFRELDRLVESAAVHYSAIVPQRCTSDQSVQVIGILGDSDLDYLISFLAISRLGHSVLLLSTRITDEAYQSLLSQTEASILLYQPSFIEAAQNAQAALGSIRIEPLCNVLEQPEDVALSASNLDGAQETNKISFIIHSSGSTGLPKPIYQTHRASLYSYSQNFGLVGFITLPLYHNHGISCFFRAFYSRKQIYIYNARLPLTSGHLLTGLADHPEIQILYGVPYALKLLGETPEGIRLLSRLEIVMFGGSACPKSLGDRLVDNGVNLVGHYGATEVGQLMTSFRPYETDKGWDWLRTPDNLRPYLSMEERGPNLFELCVRDGWPSKVATNREDGSYATKDLFEPHEALPNTWRYYARLDDTLVLENGEKANPLQLEGLLRNSREVAEAVVFGSGKARLGAFIVPAESTKLTDSGILDAIMPDVEKQNARGPAYSQLTRDMLKVLPKDVSYRRTDKGTVIRAAFYRDFATEIEAMYQDIATGTAVLSRDELKAFLRLQLESRLMETKAARLADDTDIFSLGVDSLQTIQMRKVILQTIKLPQKEELGRNFVFDFPTIEAMAEEILRVQSGGSKETQASIEERTVAMIEKYAVFKRHRPVAQDADGHHMVVTGATGSLGAHLVRILASDPAVKKITCLVRASDESSALQRVKQSLEERKLEISTEEQQKIRAWPSDFSDAQLGLTETQYTDLTSEVTHVFHLAWSVNFNKGLESFEKDCIAGAANLIKLCLQAKRPAPASFDFCSSVSVTARTPGDAIAEALPATLASAQSMGYAQSKLVTEHICDRASSTTGMQARVLRVGQIMGDTEHGVWNATEAIPMIFQTAQTIGALPTLDEDVAWLPVDVVARAFAETAISGSDASVINVVNPRTFHWTRDLLPLLHESGLQFEEVDKREWVRCLRRSDQDPAKNPPIKLVDFFASKYDNDNTPRSLKYRTEKAQSCSPSLREVKTLDKTLMQKIIAHLQSVWVQGG